MQGIIEDETNNSPKLKIPKDPADLPDATLAFAARVFEAARNGTEESNVFLEAAFAHGLPANLRNESGNSLVMLAAYHGHPQTVRIILKYGGDPNILNDRGQSIIAGAIFKNENEVAKILLDAGADPLMGEPSALATAEMFKNGEMLTLIKSKLEDKGKNQEPIVKQE